MTCRGCVESRGTSTVTAREYKGMLLFPRRGVPPEPLPGYEEDPGNPYIHILTQPPCQYRIKKERVRACCGKTTYSFCIKLQVPAPRTLCHDCQEARP